MDSRNHALELPEGASDADVIVAVYNEINSLSRWLSTPDKEPIQEIEHIMSPIASFAQGEKASPPQQETLADYTERSLNDIIKKLDTARARTEDEELEEQLTRCIESLEEVEGEMYW